MRGARYKLLVTQTVASVAAAVAVSSPAHAGLFSKSKDADSSASGVPQQSADWAAEVNMRS